MKEALKSKSGVGSDLPTNSVADEHASDPHAKYIHKQIEEFRKQLLGMTLNNHFLNCRHVPDVQAQVRVVDELPDPVFQRLEIGREFTFLPLPEPRDRPDDEDSKEFLEALETYKNKAPMYAAAIKHVSAQRGKEAKTEEIERDARNHVRLRLGMGEWKTEHGLSPEDLCRRRGIDPSYELPSSTQEESAARHHDAALQTLLSEDLLSAKLAHLRDRAKSHMSQTGVATLFAAFGFLEWFESDNSDQPHLAPLILVPGELNRQLSRGRYLYRFRGTEEPATANVTLEVYLRQNFGLQLPALDTDDSPESYWEKIQNEICAHSGRWCVRRFLTISLFTYSKLAIYEDLNGDGWPSGHGLVAHDNIRTLLAQSGVSDIPYAENRKIDADEWTSKVPILIYDADSSQHSAIADVLSGKNLTIFGPPGTGKSQTIANTIAAATMAGKKVLFVSEKLTALEVVRDRLDRAGLGPFCFNLHARGLKSSEVRRSLDERMSMPPPNFEPSRYERQRQDWTRQRDALKTYARVMGAKVGKMDETVHDVLWRIIDRKASETGLPAAVSVARLAKVEEISPTEVDEARSSIDRLANAEVKFTGLVESGSRLPWRGAMRTNLSPVDVQRTIQQIADWEQGLAELESLLSASGLSGETMTSQEAEFVHQGAELVRSMPYAAGLCGLASLSRRVTRDGIAQAARRARRLQEIDGVLIERCGINTNQLPRSEQLRALAASADSLGMLTQSPSEAKTQARILRDRAAECDRVESVLIRLASCFEFGVLTQESLKTMERAVELLNEARADDLLSFRTIPLVTHDAHRILDRAEAECRDLKERRDDIGKRFDLASLPSIDELQKATRALNAARGPLLFDGAAKRAMRLHRGVTLVQSKRSPDDAAKDLRELIEYSEASTRLVEDEEIKHYLGGDWQGVNSEFTMARQVAEWAARVLDKLAGEGDGRSGARKILLRGDIERLAEIRRIAEELPSNWQTPATESTSSDARERATRLEELADDSQKHGLDESKPFASAADLAALIDEYRALTAEADGDNNVALLFPSQKPDFQTLDLVRTLADAMSALELTDEAWTQTASFLAHAGEVEKTCSTLKAVLTLVGDAWRACVEALELDAVEFLDGGQHDATGLRALRERAQETLGAGDTLLSWSAYQRARKSVQRSHAAPVLAALDKHCMSATRLREAYEWALYQSLTVIVYRQHPELNELSNWQLDNHRAAFQDLDTRLQELERARICYELYSRPIETGVDFGGPRAFTEKALIRHHLSLQRSNVTLRDLLRRAGTALRQMKPCFMMSPTTVAELLPRDSTLFDIVIIDEASQMLPCDALGAIMRSSHAVIVGDPKQLPPSTYFQGGATAAQDNDDDKGMLAPAVKSILDLSLSAWHPPRYLQWHYRSRHSSLIQFSNARFYDNRLIVFPGPDEHREDSGIRYHHIADGLVKKGLNRIEAELVVDAACAFMEDPANRDLSLAIVTMNQKQRDLINDSMDHKAAENPAVARYRKRWRHSLYPFIVRNLETIQGDERDVIFISTVYGRETVGGQVMRRFGPITHDGGERRLNVLFTRARQRMEVFSSMQANEIDVGPGVSEGVRIFRDYLEYAATGRIATGINTGREPESPFEECVLRRLRDKGLEVDPQVGVAGFRVDVGVRHADYPHGYLLGVECDGRTYHSALSVRDRDRLREAVLRDLGWDIYRIWSTDWFQDADLELKKLMNYITDRIDAFRAGSAVASGESVLSGEVVATSAEQSAKTVTREDSPQELDDDAIYVDVGDTVSYHEADRELDIRQVTIVRGKDDPNNDIINDHKPLAGALLGAEVGETVTVRQPTREFMIVVDRIERPELEINKPLALGVSTSVDGVVVLPYVEWSGNADDPHTASPDDIEESLRAIVEAEGPVLVDRAYRGYVRASGIQRLSQQVRRILNYALERLERGGLVVVEGGEKWSGYRNALLRCPNAERVKVREIGPRSFDEIPDSELDALIEAVRSSRRDDGSDEIYRQVLSIYGLVRMTAQVRRRFEKIEKN